MLCGGGEEIDMGYQFKNSGVIELQIVTIFLIKGLSASSVFNCSAHLFFK